MRIAVITSSYPQNDEDPSGHFVRTEVMELVKQGHQVTVICPGAPTAAGQNPEIVRLGATGLFGWPGALTKLRANPFVAWQLLPFLRRARRMLRDNAYDRVIAHWLVPCGWPIAQASPGETEIVIHGSDARLVGALPAFVRDQLLSRLRSRGRRLRFVAAHLKPLVATPRTHSWVNDSRVAASPLTLPTSLSKADARRALGLDHTSYVALVIGRLVPGKRVDVALERAPLPPSARVWVIGSGPCLHALSRRFPHVTFLGQLPRTQTLLWLKASDVLLNASLAEGAPSVVREARALDVEVWSAPCAVVSAWAREDAGISIRPELC